MRGILRGKGWVLAVGHWLIAAALSTDWVFSKYPNLARGLHENTLSAAQVGDASPAYLLLNAWCAPGVLRWAQTMLAGLAAWGLFEVLRRRASEAAAWVGGGLLAFSSSWVVYGAVLEPDLLIGVALVGASAALMLRERSDRWWLLAAAVALGIAISLRPTGLVFAALAGLWLVWERTPWRSLAMAAVLAGACAATPALVLHLQAGQDLRGTMSAGQVFHQSHRPETVGFGAVFPSMLKLAEAQASTGAHPPDYAHALYRDLARAQEPGLSDQETEWFWLKQSLAFITESPAAVASQQLEKALFFVAPLKNEYDIPAVLPLLEQVIGLPLRWLSLLAAGGVLIALVRRDRTDRVWLLGYLAAWLVAQLFYFHGRYAVGLVPTLAALAGLGVAQLWHAKKSRSVWGYAGLLAAPWALLLVPSLQWGDRLAERTAALGQPAPSANEEPDAWARAVTRYVEQQAAMPDVFWPSAAFGAGVGADEPSTVERASSLARDRWGTQNPVDETLLAGLLATSGHCDEALALASQAVATGFAWSIGDGVIDPEVISSDCLLRTGHRSEAVRALEATNRARPGRLEVLVRLIAAADTGSATDASRWEHELFAYHDAVSAHAALARERLAWGDPDGSLADADWLEGHWQLGHPFAAFARAQALLALHREDEAMVAWRDSLVLVAPLHGLARLDALAKRAAHSTDPGWRAAALRHFRLRGLRSEVRALLSGPSTF